MQILCLQIGISVVEVILARRFLLFLHLVIIVIEESLSISIVLNRDNLRPCSATQWEAFCLYQ